MFDSLTKPNCVEFAFKDIVYHAECHHYLIAAAGKSFWTLRNTNSQQRERLTRSDHPRCLPAGQQQQQQPGVQVRRRGHNLLRLRARANTPLALQLPLFPPPLYVLFNSPVAHWKFPPHTPAGSPLPPHYLHPHLCAASLLFFFFSFLFFLIPQFAQSRSVGM